MKEHIKILCKQLLVIVALTHCGIPLLQGMELEQRHQRVLGRAAYAPLAKHELKLLATCFAQIKKLPTEIIVALCAYLPYDEPAFMALVNYTGLTAQQASGIVNSYVREHQTSPLEAFKDYSKIYYAIKCAWQEYRQELDGIASGLIDCKDGVSAHRYLARKLPHLVLSGANDTPYSVVQLTQLRKDILYTLYCLNNFKNAVDNRAYNLLTDPVPFTWFTSISTVLLLLGLTWILVYYSVYDFAGCKADIKNTCISDCFYKDSCKPQYYPCNTSTDLSHNLDALSSCCNQLAETDCDIRKQSFNTKYRPIGQLQAWSPVLGFIGFICVICCVCSGVVKLTRPKYCVKAQVKEFLDTTIRGLRALLKTVEDDLRELRQV